MRAYRDRAPYVRARFEPGGETLASITLADADPSDTRGYGDWWPLPAAWDVFIVPAPHADAMARVPADTAFRASRIEPHLNPPWGEPVGGFA